MATRPALIDKAIAHARYNAYRVAEAMTTAELQECEPSYRAATGIGDGPVTGEALTQLRMINTILARRGRPRYTVSWHSSPANAENYL